MDIQGHFHWTDNPFSFRILPDLFVGYAEETQSLIQGVRNGDKFVLLLGPTGAGKTTLLRHISRQFPDYVLLYLPKPPKDPKDWVTIFTPYLRSWWMPLSGQVDLYNLSARLQKKFGGKKCLLFVDECHEATQESLEWLRTITDQVEHLTVVLAGLPIFENVLKETLETFLRRVTVRVDLGSLSQAETREFIKKRIESVGGQDIQPFTAGLVEQIYQRTGGFPREILRVCNELSQKAVTKGLTMIDTDFLSEAEVDARTNQDFLEGLPARQKLIMDTLAQYGPLTPTEVVEKLQAQEEYKDQDNAIRSVNNLVRRLMSDGLVERKKIGKAFKYNVSPRYQPLLVKA